MILGRPYMRCNISPDDLMIGRESHCTFSSRVALLTRFCSFTVMHLYFFRISDTHLFKTILINHSFICSERFFPPIFNSTLLNPQGQCSTRNEGYCEWDLIKLGLKRLCLKVDGENQIGHENSLRPLILSHISTLDYYTFV